MGKLQKKKCPSRFRWRNGAGVRASVALILTTWFGRLSGSDSEQQAEAGQHGDAAHVEMFLREQVGYSCWSGSPPPYMLAHSCPRSHHPSSITVAIRPSNGPQTGNHRRKCLPISASGSLAPEFTTAQGLINHFIPPKLPAGQQRGGSQPLKRGAATTTCSSC